MSANVDQNSASDESTKASSNSSLKPPVDYGYQQEQSYQGCGTYELTQDATVNQSDAYIPSYYAQYVTVPAASTDMWSSSTDPSCSYFPGYLSPSSCSVFDYNSPGNAVPAALSGYGWDYSSWPADTTTALYNGSGGPPPEAYYAVQMYMNGAGVGDIDNGGGGDYQQQQQYIPIEQSLNALSLSPADQPNAWTLVAGQLLSNTDGGGSASRNRKLSAASDYCTVHHWPRQIPQRANRLNGLTAAKQSATGDNSCSIVRQLQLQHDYNPKEFNLKPLTARYFVIKSYSEDDIHRSIKYGIWCSTEYGNKRLDAAYHERQGQAGQVYLLFSVNGSGHFCGVAEMTSPVDYESSAGVWAQNKWKGQFKVRWIYVKDVPNSQLRHIRLENNEGKPVTNSRDTQEVPADKGNLVLRIIHDYRHTTSIFDDFLHYEQRQEECKSLATTTQQLYTSCSTDSLAPPAVSLSSSVSNELSTV